MLTLLVPWFYNLELIDTNVCKNEKLETSTTYGSQVATEVILNNLFYLTLKFSDQYTAELELLWAILSSTWRSNLKIICRYIYIMISLATYEMLSTGKRIFGYIIKVTSQRVINELISELQQLDSYCSAIYKCENIFPFYRYSRVVPAPQSPKVTSTPSKKVSCKNEKIIKEDNFDEEGDLINNSSSTNNNFDDNETEDSNLDSDENESESNDSNDSDDSDNDDDDDDDDDDDENYSDGDEDDALKMNEYLMKHSSVFNFYNNNEFPILFHSQFINNNITKSTSNNENNGKLFSILLKQ
jgi:hypothetical protein